MHIKSNRKKTLMGEKHAPAYICLISVFYMLDTHQDTCENTTEKLSVNHVHPHRILTIKKYSFK